jgi:hypothetical protein
MCILYRKVYRPLMHRQYIHTLEVRMATSSIVIHYIGRGCQSPKPQEIHKFVWSAALEGGGTHKFGVILLLYTINFGHLQVKLKTCGSM